jgi:hypothetical protein
LLEAFPYFLPKNILLTHQKESEVKGASKELPIDKWQRYSHLWKWEYPCHEEDEIF